MAIAYQVFINLVLNNTYAHDWVVACCELSLGLLKVVFVYGAALVIAVLILAVHGILYLIWALYYVFGKVQEKLGIAMFSLHSLLDF